MTEQFKVLWEVPRLLHVFFQSYLLLTVLLFFFGPWDWVVYDPLKLTAFLAAAQIAIWMGYRMSRLMAERLTPDAAMIEGNRRLAKVILGVSAIVSIALVPPTALSRTGLWLPDPVLAWENLGRAYNDNNDRLLMGNPYVMVEYIRIILGPLLAALFPLLVIYWRRVPLWMKALGCACVVSIMLIYFSTGTNKGIADVIVTLPILVIIANKIKNVRSRIVFTRVNTLGLIAFVFFLIFFGLTQETRRGMVGELGVFNAGTFIIYADSAGVAENWSQQWIIIYESIVRYLTQGYQALSISFEIDTAPTFGIGHSMFLSENVDAWLGTHYFTEQSIPGQLDARFGIDRLALWHSIYPWLASDVGYVGTIFVMFVFSVLLFTSLFLVIRTEDPIMAVLAYLMVILFFYIPGNNQLFQTGETTSAFFVVAILAVVRLIKYLPRKDAMRLARPVDAARTAS